MRVHQVYELSSGDVSVSKLILQTSHLELGTVVNLPGRVVRVLQALHLFLREA